MVMLALWLLAGSHYQIGLSYRIASEILTACLSRFIQFQWESENLESCLLIRTIIMIIEQKE